MIKVAVIGANSMVGSRFCDLTDLNLIKADLNGSNKIDITSKTSVDSFFKNYVFDYVILFSAFTDVDAAEIQRNDKNGTCWQINVEGTKNIAANCQKKNIGLVLISTETVFSGTNGPYAEEMEPGSDEELSWYGVTKKYSEIEAEKLKNFIILRISYPYRAKYDQKTDFARNILELAKEKKLYPMFSDQIITPTFIDDCAPAIDLLLNSKFNGIIHLASPSTTSPYEFAVKLLNVFGESYKVDKGSLIEYLQKNIGAKRPVLGGLKVTKLQSLGFMPTGWDKGIEIIAKQSYN